MELSTISSIIFLHECTFIWIVDSVSPRRHQVMCFLVEDHVSMIVYLLPDTMTGTNESVNTHLVSTYLILVTMLGAEEVERDKGAWSVAQETCK